MRGTPQEEQELVDLVGSYTHDPLGFVLAMFPWGEPDLPPDEHGYAGPRKWQRELLEELGARLRAGKINHWQAIQEAVASGHDIGKSALVSWLVLWALSTFEDTRGIVTASGERQLKTKTWPEIAKWHRLMLNSHWFVFEKTSIYSSDPRHADTWRIDMIVWNESNPEAFQGLHNKGKRIIVVFDEASAIADIIWETTEGALIDEDTEILWFVFGNPTRNSGRFRQCFGSLRHRWSQGKPRNIDSRTVEGTNKQQLQNLIEDYGDDHNIVRVRVKGLFPHASDLQFISSALVADAQKRDPLSTLYDPLVMSIDFARGGDDNTVIRMRRGMDARTIPPIKLTGSESRDSMRVVSVATHAIEKHNPDAIFVDATGIGGPIANRLRQLGYRVFEVHFGNKSPNPKYANMRSFCWGRMADWLQAGGAIDSDPVLEQDLTCIEFGHDNKDRVILEKKEHMKARGLASPDDGDALAIGFAYPVPPRAGAGYSRARQVRKDYDPFSDERMGRN
jgi:hypothetical protein